MPYKNVLKKYIEKGFYHIYSRGLNKKDIFIDKQDYKFFLNCLKLYLLPKERTIEIIKRLDLSEDYKVKKLLKLTYLENFYKKINLFVFVLMPNHFHFLVQQQDRYSIKFFIKSLLTKYSMYFNKKYNRVGPVFHGRYRAVIIDNENYFLHLSRYIHLNPKKILLKDLQLIDYPWSSYPFYVKNYKADWLKKDLLLSYFLKTKGFGFDSYQGFVEGYINEEIINYYLKPYIIE